MSEARNPSPDEHRPRIRFGPKSVEATMKAAPTGPVKMGRLPFRAKLGLAWVGLVILVAIFAHWLSPYDPYTVGLTTPNTGPDWPEHIFGSDEIARDILSRVIHGSRMSALVAVMTPVLALILGGTVGMVAASTSRNRRLRWINDVLMRLVDIQFAFPAVVLAVVVSSAFGQSFRTLLLVLTVVYTPIMARYIRAAVLDQLGEDYVAALRAMGSSQLRILLRHVSLQRGPRHPHPLKPWSGTTSTDLVERPPGMRGRVKVINLQENKVRFTRD